MHAERGAIAESLGTSHARWKPNVLQELEGHVSKMHPVPGTANPADAFTKHLSKPAFKQYMARLYNVSPDVF